MQINLLRWLGGSVCDFGSCVLVVLLLGAAGLGTGCQPKPSSGGPSAGVGDTGVSEVAGTYTLLAVDDRPVPCAVTHGGHAMKIESGQFVIAPDGVCVSRIYLAGRTHPIERRATSSREGGKLSMRWKGAGQTQGWLEGRTFTMNNEGMVFRYAKP